MLFKHNSQSLHANALLTVLEVKYNALLFSDIQGESFEPSYLATTLQEEPEKPEIPCFMEIPVIDFLLRTYKPQSQHLLVT